MKQPRLQNLVNFTKYKRIKLNHKEKFILKKQKKKNLNSIISIGFLSYLLFSYCFFFLCNFQNNTAHIEMIKRKMPKA